MIALFLALALLGAAPGGGHADPWAWGGVEIRSVTYVNRTRVRDREIRDLLPLRVGRPYDPAAVQQGLEALGRKVQIRTVRILGEPVGGDLAVRVEVEPAPLVWAVAFEGNRAFPDDQLASRVSTRRDAPIRDPVLRGDEARLESLYREAGFPDVRVRVDVVPAKDPQWFRVVFRVDEGPALRVVAIEPAEPLPLEAPRVERLLGLAPGAPASVRALRDGAARLVRALHRAGYPEARIRNPRFEPRDGGVVAVLPVTVGDRIHVWVDGYDGPMVSALLEEARQRFGETIDDDWTGVVAGAMEERLRRAGYPAARVEPALDFAYGRRRATFRVSPGPGPVRLGDLRFEGARLTDPDALRRVMALATRGFLLRPPFSEAALEADLDRVHAYCVSLGLWGARATVEDLQIQGTRAEVVVRLDEGPLYRFGAVLFEGELGLGETELAGIAGIEPGDPALPAALERARTQLLDALWADGFYSARVVRRIQVHADSAEVDAIFKVDAGPRIQFGRVLVTGNTRTQTKVIRRELDLDRGDPWDPRAVTRNRRRLSRLGFFERVNIAPLPPGDSADERDVQVSVVEQDAGSVTFGIGYATEERLKVRAGVAHTNLGGYGRSLGLRLDYDALESSYALNLREPWLFNHRLDLLASLLRRTETRPAYELVTEAVQVRLEKTFLERAKGAFLLSREWNDPGNLPQDPQSVAADDTYWLTAFGPLVVWDSTDDPFNPRRGIRWQAQAEWSPEALGSEMPYERYTGGISGFASYRALTVAVNAKAGVAFTRGGKANLPINKRFFLGGRSTVRGFGRDVLGPKDAEGTPVGGDAMLNLKAELRFPIKGQFGGALFWDAGNVWNRSFDDPINTDVRQAVGWGLRLKTPVGPVSLDVGYKLDRKAGESPYEWHFTVGSVF